MTTRDRGGNAGKSVLELAWIGHSTVVVDVDGVRLLTDPLLRSHAGLLRRIGPPPDHRLWRDPDAVLVSHLHPDHAELASLRMLPDVPVLTAPRNAAWLRRHGLTAAVDTGERWVPVGAGAVEARLVRADHRHRQMPHRPNEAHGHLVRSPSARLWLAGDTSLYPEMRLLPELAGGALDLVVVPVGGWGPRLSPGHMTPAEAATACARVGARRAMPVHWGTFHPPLVTRFGRGWLERPGEEFADALSRAAPACQAVVLEPGEVRTVPLTAGGSVP